MVIYGYRWFHMVIGGFYIAIHGYRWLLVVVCGFNGYWWLYVVSHGYRWFYMVSYRSKNLSD